MKKIIPFAFVILTALGFWGCDGQMFVTESAGISSTPVTYQRFYDELSPYGRWVDYPGYGYVWAPTEINFRPYYSNGYWVNTNMGWSWVSDYNWGWAPFHYGRWFYEAGYGWLWLPGYEWAPAWVSWRNHADYYGWAPLAPGMDLGFVTSINIPAEHWSFVQHGFINDRNFRQHCADEHDADMIYRNSSFINNTGFNSNKTRFARGPELREVAGFTGQKITPAVIREHTDAQKTHVDDTKKEVRIFKPTVHPGEDKEVMKPKTVTPYKDLPHDNGRRGTWPPPPSANPKTKTENKPGRGN